MGMLVKESVKSKISNQYKQQHQQKPGTKHLGNFGAL